MQTAQTRTFINYNNSNDKENLQMLSKEQQNGFQELHATSCFGKCVLPNMHLLK